MPVCRDGQAPGQQVLFAAQDLPGVRARDGLAPPLGGLLERRAFLLRRMPPQAHAGAGACAINTDRLTFSANPAVDPA